MTDKREASEGQRFCALLSRLRKFFYTKVLRRKYYRSGKCNCCGRCCEKIYVKHGKGGVIKDEKLFEKLKFLHSFYFDLICIGSDELGLIFSCTNLDPETRKCKKHKGRAKICRDYPQEELFLLGGGMGEDCGYKFTPIVSFGEVFEKMKKQKTVEGSRKGTAERL